MKKTKNLMRACILTSLFFLLAACSGTFSGNGGTKQNEPGSDQTKELIQAFDKGVIARQSEDADRWLITQAVETEDSSYIEAMWLDIAETTRFEDSEGNQLTASDFQIGHKVSAAYTGPLRESYPSQAEAGKIVLLDAESQRSPVAENDAFRLFSPAPMELLDLTFTVTGEARVFEASFLWSIEDGHNILAEGSAMADHGAPEWGRFEFEVSLAEPPAGNLMLVLYTASPKDGSIEHALSIPISLR